jgi:hypothetical protein
MGLHTKHKARVELNFFDYSDSKRCYAEPHVVNYDEDSKPQYDLILSTETMKELGIMLDFNFDYSDSKRYYAEPDVVKYDEDSKLQYDLILGLPMRNINHLQGHTILRILKHNNSLAKEPMSTQDATRHAIQMLNAKYDKADLRSIVKNNCKHLSTNQQSKLLQLLMK